MIVFIAASIFSTTIPQAIDASVEFTNVSARDCEETCKSIDITYVVKNRSTVDICIPGIFATAEIADRITVDYKKTLPLPIPEDGYLSLTGTGRLAKDIATYRVRPQIVIPGQSEISVHAIAFHKFSIRPTGEDIAMFLPVYPCDLRNDEAYLFMIVPVVGTVR